MIEISGGLTGRDEVRPFPRSGLRTHLSEGADDMNDRAGIWSWWGSQEFQKSKPSGSKADEDVNVFSKWDSKAQSDRGGELLVDCRSTAKNEKWVCLQMRKLQKIIVRRERSLERPVKEIPRKTSPYCCSLAGWKVHFCRDPSDISGLADCRAGRMGTFDLLLRCPTVLFGEGIPVILGTFPK